MIEFFIDKLLRMFAKWILPVPLLEKALGDFLCKHKLQVGGVIAFLAITPILLLGGVFGSPIQVIGVSSQDQMSKQFFDRKYAVECRDVAYPCESKPEFKNQFINCQNDPIKCRKIRKTGDCSDLFFRDKYCQSISNSTVTTNLDGTSSNSISTSITKKPGADELYYFDQQLEEERLFLGSPNYGNIQAGSSGIGASNVNWQDPANAPVIGSIPALIKDYIEPGFVDSGNIQLNPFGRSGYSTTCGYLCYSGGIYGTHYGYDMVASVNYYNTNQASEKLNGKPVFFATCSGVAFRAFDNISGNQVYINCDNTNYFVSYFHLREYYLPTDGSQVKVKAGQPIGIMGGEGGQWYSGQYTTGTHLHYGVYQNCTGYGPPCTINPANFLSN
jgi:murein DD-endopeptidase MepM/ murein hydrolase activator NlpD